MSSGNVFEFLLPKWWWMYALPSRYATSDCLALFPVAPASYSYSALLFFFFFVDGINQIQIRHSPSVKQRKFNYLNGSTFLQVVLICYFIFFIYCCCFSSPLIIADIFPLNAVQPADFYQFKMSRHGDLINFWSKLSWEWGVAHLIHPEHFLWQVGKI